MNQTMKKCYRGIGIIAMVSGLLVACGSASDNVSSNEPVENVVADAEVAATEDTQKEDETVQETRDEVTEGLSEDNDQEDMSIFNQDDVVETEKVYVSPAKTPAQFKKAEEIEFGEVYEFSTAVKYTFEVERSGEFNFWFDNGPAAELYDQEGNQLFKFWPDYNITDFDFEDTEDYFLKAGRYYLEVKPHTTDGRYNDPRKDEPDSISVDYTDSNESFIESYDLSDNSPEYANVIRLGKTYYGQIGYDDLFDVYKFSLPKDAEVTIFYKSTIPHAEYGLIDSELKMVPENLNGDAEQLAETIGKNSLEVGILKALFSEPRFIGDGEDSLTQKIQLEKGEYYFSTYGNALSGTYLPDNSGTYEFKIYVE